MGLGTFVVAKTVSCGFVQSCRVLYQEEKPVLALLWRCLVVFFYGSLGRVGVSYYKTFLIRLFAQAIFLLGGCSGVVRVCFGTCSGLLRSSFGWASVGLRF